MFIILQFRAQATVSKYRYQVKVCVEIKYEYLLRPLRMPGSYRMSTQCCAKNASIYSLKIVDVSLHQNRQNLSDDHMQIAGLSQEGLGTEVETMQCKKLLLQKIFICFDAAFHSWL